MRERILIAGHGGQGVLFAGYILAESLIRVGWHVVVFPSYGIQMRGGTANIWVVASNDSISSPICSIATLLVTMNQPSFLRFSPQVQKDGLIIVNSTLVKVEDSANNHAQMLLLPATSIASKIFNERLANMVMLGGLCAQCNGLVNIDSVSESLSEFLKDKNLIEFNKKALIEGFEYVSQMKS